MKIIVVAVGAALIAAALAAAAIQWLTAIRSGKNRRAVDLDDVEWRRAQRRRSKDFR